MNKAYSVLISIFVFTSCSERPEKGYSDADIFRYNEAAGITSLDPAFAKNQAHIWVCNQLYNSLVQLDDSLNVIPSLAESWTVDSTGLIYTFQLRKDVLFHNNACFKPSEDTRILKASDVVFSLERLRSPELSAPGSWTLSNVKESGIKAIDDYTVSFELKEPFPAFLGLLTMQYCSILSEHAFQKFGKDYFEYAIGTGPFYFKLWVDRVKLVLRKNTDYFEKINGVSLPHLESVAIRFIPDKFAAFLEFVKGDLDFISGIDASYKDEVLDFNGDLQEKYQKDIRLIKQNYLNTEYLGFLVDQEKSTYPYNNRYFRRAVNFAFDRQKMIRYLRNGIGSPAEHGMIPNGLPSFEKTNSFSFNKDSVLENLTKSGYVEKGSPEVVLHTNSSYLDLCEYIQYSLREMGINLSIEVHPPSTLRQLISAQKVQFFRASWIADYPDAENYLSLFYSENFAPNGPNYTHFKLDEFDAMYKACYVETDLDKRRSLYRKMNRIIMEEAAVVPLFYDEVYRFSAKGTQGLGGNALNLLSLKNVKKSE